MNDRTISLVVGYHDCSYPPRAAYDAGLRSRFAVVLSTYREAAGEMVFDSELAGRVLKAVCGAIAHDDCDVELSDNIHLKSVTELMAAWDRLPVEDRGPPLTIGLRKAGRLVGLEQTEFWAAVGGPDIYHDSYTLSFYTADDRSHEFRELCEQICADVGAVISGVHHAAPRKAPRLPWYLRPLELIGRRLTPSPGT